MGHEHDALDGHVLGILVVPLGIASITLIIFQPVAVGAWCTPCLIAVVAMLT